MLNKDLIKRLSEFPGDFEVKFWTDYDGWLNINKVDTDGIFTNIIALEEKEDSNG